MARGWRSPGWRNLGVLQETSRGCLLGGTCGSNLLSQRRKSWRLLFLLWSTLLELKEAKMSWFCLKEMLRPAPSHLLAVEPQFPQATYMGGKTYPGKTCP